jgi:hypothetical protein
VLNNPTSLIDPLGPGALNPEDPLCFDRLEFSCGDDGGGGGGGYCIDPVEWVGCTFPINPPDRPPGGRRGGGGGGGRGTLNGGSQPEPGNTGGNALFGNPLPCVDPSALQAAILTALNGVFQPVQSISGSQIGPSRVQGGGNDFDFPDVTILPRQLPQGIQRVNPVLGKIFNHPQKYQVYVPVPQPSDSVPSVPGPGKVLHVTFDEGAVDPSTHLPVLSKISAHFDLSNPVQGDVAGLVGHVFGDVLAAALAQHVQHGCGVKFQ